MNEKVLTSVQPVKLPLRVKIGYSVGSAAKALLAVSTAAFLLYFYTDVCGIDPVVASTIIMIAKIWDIVNDPIMGAIVDRTASKEGKCLFFLKRFSVPAGIIVALSFTMPNFAMPGRVVWALVTYILQDMASTSLLIPLNTLMGRITSEQKEQAKLSQYSNFFSLIGQYAVQGYMMISVAALGGGINTRGFMLVGIILGAIYALLHLIVYWSVKGYEPVEQPAQPAGEETKLQEKQHTPLKEALAALIKNRMWLWVMVVFFFESLALYSEAAVMQFYFQYNHGNDMSLYTIYSNITLAAAILIILGLSFVVGKFGTSKTAMAGCLLAFAGYAVRFLLRDESQLIMGIGWSLGAVGTTLFNGVILLLIFEARDWGARRTGVSNDALLMSGYSVAYKIGSALGGCVAGFLMPAAYVSGAATQVESVQRYFFNWSTLYPCIAFVIAIAAMLVVMKYERELKDGK